MLPYSLPEWEKLSIFLTFLIPKLPAPKEEDFSQGILDFIDMDSYQAEKRSTLALALDGADAEIDPANAGGYAPEPEMDRLSNINNQFNLLFGNLPCRRKSPPTRPIRMRCRTQTKTVRGLNTIMPCSVLCRH